MRLDDLEEGLPKLLAVARAAKAWGDTTGCHLHTHVERQVATCALCLADELVEDELLDAVADLEAL